MIPQSHLSRQQQPIPATLLQVAVDLGLDLFSTLRLIVIIVCVDLGESSFFAGSILVILALNSLGPFALGCGGLFARSLVARDRRVNRLGAAV